MIPSSETSATAAFPILGLSPDIPAATVAMSSASPPTRPQTQGVGSSEARMPIPFTTSRTP